MHFCVVQNWSLQTGNHYKAENSYCFHFEMCRILIYKHFRSFMQKNDHLRNVECEPASLDIRWPFGWPSSDGVSFFTIHSNAKHSTTARPHLDRFFFNSTYISVLKLLFKTTYIHMSTIRYYIISYKSAYNDLLWKRLIATVNGSPVNISALSKLSIMYGQIAVFRFEFSE